MAALTLCFAVTAVFAADEAREMKILKATAWTVPGIGIKMKLVPAGTFAMGSPKKEISRRADEIQHKVTISKPFYMGVCELRQREFYKLMMPADYDHKSWRYQRGPLHHGAAWTYRRKAGGENVYADNAAVGTPRTDLNPMECVSWDRAVEFCSKLTEIEKKAGRLPKGYVYRLPTEAEWEYACRAGSKGAYSFDGDYSKDATLLKYMFIHGGGDYKLFTSATPGERQPNAWGLFDMHGNVYEWCLDWYGPYDPKAKKDPTGPKTGKERVARGGGVGAVDKNLNTAVHPFFRSASRYRFLPTTGYQINLGFRVVLGPAVGMRER
jgi:formylglycine-generating enzyme required for sulfatase activity